MVNVQGHVPPLEYSRVLAFATRSRSPRLARPFDIVERCFSSSTRRVGSTHMPNEDIVNVLINVQGESVTFIFRSGEISYIMSRTWSK